MVYGPHGCALSYLLPPPPPGKDPQAAIPFDITLMRSGLPVKNLFPAAVPPRIPGVFGIRRAAAYRAVRTGTGARLWAARAPNIESRARDTRLSARPGIHRRKRCFSAPDLKNTRIRGKIEPGCGRMVVSVLPRCALHALPDTGRYLPLSVTNEPVISTTHPMNRFMVNRSPPAQPPQSTPLSTNRVILHMLYMRSGR